MSKKVIPLICEGNSDLIALEDYLNAIFENKEIRFVVTRGDILGDDNLDDSYLNDLIEENIEENLMATANFGFDDILEIAQVIDTDGVFEDDNVVHLDSSFDKAMYYDNKITVPKNVPKALESRRNRRIRINECIETKMLNIKGRDIPYRIYYMSSNLEHVTQNERNVSSDAEKFKLATEFSMRFDNIEDFIQFLRSNNSSDTLDYLRSWSYIKKHSLSKSTNLIIFVERILNSY